jgi:hypothetical protein
MNAWRYAAAQWLRHYATSRKVAVPHPMRRMVFLSIYLILPAPVPGVYSATNINKNVCGE